MNLSIGHRLNLNSTKDFSLKDYYPFGMLMPGRNFSSENYQFGFNGKLKDDELLSSGNYYDYGMRNFDPRLGRFFSVDPLTKKYPWYSPYQFAGNKPIWAIDLDGLEEWKVTGNMITFQASYVAFKNRPQGGNVPNNVDIININKSIWDSYNQNLQNQTYKLNISKNDVQKYIANEGSTLYTVQFDIQVIVLNDETEMNTNQQVIDARTNKSLAGVFLFGDTEYKGYSFKMDPAASATWNPDKDPVKPTYTDDNVILFNIQNSTYLNSDALIHEVGHDFKLTHFGVEERESRSLGYLDPRGGLFATYIAPNGAKYNESGMMKCNYCSGSQIPFDTQIKNMLNSNPGTVEQP